MSGAAVGSQHPSRRFCERSQLTLRMGDATTVANLPPDLDAYGCYVDGKYANCATIRTAYPGAHYLTISVLGYRADCADVELGAMSNWVGYNYGYCSVSRVNALIARDGRPQKLWTAHYTNIPHICSPTCWPGLVTIADGTQWTNHGGLWDESLLADNFFDLNVTPLPTTEGDMIHFNDSQGTNYLAGIASDQPGHVLVFSQTSAGWDVVDVTDAATATAHAHNPADTRIYTLVS